MAEKQTKAEKKDAEDQYEDVDEEEEEKEETLQTPGVLDKYQQAGKIANIVLQKVIDACVPGKNIVDICELGDKLIVDELSKCYAKKQVEKGIAFPTCISRNEICGHFSPLKSEALEKDKAISTIVEGDVLKIDLGVHIDGYIALAAHTIVAQQDPTKPIQGKKASVILAAYNAIQGALRTIKPGNKNNADVTPIIEKICDAYKCKPVDGVLSFELKKHVIDGNNCIANRSNYEAKIDDHEFNIHEVYALDILVSTGEGKAKDSELRTTVYRRALDKSYTLKTKHGRTFFYELVEKFPSLCFSIRSFEDEITAKLGVNECRQHGLLHPYPVLAEKQGEIVAQFKVTLIILPSGLITICGLPIDEKKFEPETKMTDPDLIKLLSSKIERNTQKKAKKQIKKQQKQSKEPEAKKEEVKQEQAKN